MPLKSCIYILGGLFEFLKKFSKVFEQTSKTPGEVFSCFFFFSRFLLAFPKKKLKSKKLTTNN